MSDVVNANTPNIPILQQSLAFPAAAVLKTRQMQFLDIHPFPILKHISPPHRLSALARELPVTVAERR
jgi:hypothetical protein